MELSVGMIVENSPQGGYLGNSPPGSWLRNSPQGGWLADSPQAERFKNIATIQNLQVCKQNLRLEPLASTITIFLGKRMVIFHKSSEL